MSTLRPLGLGVALLFLGPLVYLPRFGWSWTQALHNTEASSHFVAPIWYMKCIHERWISQ